MKKFVDASKEDINNWFILCRKKQQPFIFIVPQRKYAFIEWDYLHFNRAILDNMRLREGEIIASVETISKNYQLQNLKVGTSALGGVFRGARIENSTIIAEKVYDLYNKYAYIDNSSLRQ